MRVQEWITTLLTIPLIPLDSGIGISMPAFEPQEESLNIRCDINLVKTFKLSLNLLLNKTLLSNILSLTETERRSDKLTVLYHSTTTKKNIEIR